MKQLCPYFGKCGGCSYQDMPMDAYLDMKKRYILRCFSDYELSPKLEDIVCIPLHSRRRACFAFHKGHLGFNEKKSHTIIDITSCQLLTQPLCDIIEPLRQLTKTLTTSGDIFVLDTSYGIDMHIKAPKGKTNLTILETLANFANRHNIARLLYNNDPIIERVHLPFPPDTFLQPSQAGEETLIRLMTKHIKNAQTAIDLFCGTGTFTRPLLKAGLTVTGYDSSVDSVKTLGCNGKARDLFRNPLLPNEFDHIDLVVIDPPRAGAETQTKMLSETQVPTIVMISCNPSTCARDLKILIEAGWKINEITPVDQFIYSKHIELVCALSKNTD